MDLDNFKSLDEAAPEKSSRLNSDLSKIGRKKSMLILLIYTKVGVLGLDTFKTLRDINIMLTINTNLVAVFSGIMWQRNFL